MHGESIAHHACEEKPHAGTSRSKVDDNTDMILLSKTIVGFSEIGEHEGVTSLNFGAASTNIREKIVVYRPGKGRASVKL